MTATAWRQVSVDFASSSEAARTIWAAIVNMMAA
jgi:hypothetical protein